MQPQGRLNGAVKERRISYLNEKNAWLVLGVFFCRNAWMVFIHLQNGDLWFPTHSAKDAEWMGHPALGFLIQRTWRFVLSHPLRKERTMDGAPQVLLPETKTISWKRRRKPLNRLFQ